MDRYFAMGARSAGQRFCCLLFSRAVKAVPANLRTFFFTRNAPKVYYWYDLPRPVAGLVSFVLFTQRTVCANIWAPRHALAMHQ